MERKHCAACKHLIGVRGKPETVQNWTCGHSNNIISETTDLVTGQQIIIRKIQNLHVLRAMTTPELCGPEGLWFEVYIPPERKDAGDSSPTSIGEARAKRVSLKDVTADDL